MRITRIATALLATAAGALLLTGCGGSPSPVESLTTSTSAVTTAPTTSVVTTSSTIAPTTTPDPAVAAEAARVAAESSAAAQSAADQSAADQAKADRIAAEATATTSEQSRGEWIDPNWGWVSPETAQRALDAGIPWGGDVPGYLRCGTICGESPTSGEVQMRDNCASGNPYLTAEECTAEGYPWGGAEENGSTPTTGEYHGEDDGTGMFATAPDGPCTLGETYQTFTCRQGSSGPHWQGQ